MILRFIPENRTKQYNPHSAPHLDFLKSDVEIKIEMHIFHLASRIFNSFGYNTRRLTGFLLFMDAFLCYFLPHYDKMLIRKCIYIERHG